jgi:hypothetical protein
VIERRDYYRIRTSARVALWVVPEESLPLAIARVRARHVLPPIPRGVVEERGLSTEIRAVLDVLQRISMTLERIDRRVDDVMRVQRGEDPRSVVPSDPVEISLSGSGFACPLNTPVEPGTLVELTLDLWDAGIPQIPALARVVRQWTEDDQSLAAMRFVEILPEDRERIVQLALRRQSASLREQRMGGER